MDVFDHRGKRLDEPEGEYVMSDYADRPMWTHHQGDSYTPVFGPIVGNLDHWERDWRAVADPSSTLDAAINAGLKAMDSDDFNIAVERNGCVVALLWMHEDMGEDADVLSDVGRALEMER